jgi:hypothetical protein
MSTFWSADRSTPNGFRQYPVVRVKLRTDRAANKHSFGFSPSTTTTATTTTKMFAAVRAITSQSRLFSTTAARNTKVAVLGAGGGIGQPLSLLLKSDPLVTSLSLYDIRGAPGVAADVSHVDTASEVGDCGVGICRKLSALLGSRICRRQVGRGPRGRRGRCNSRWCPKKGLFASCPIVGLCLMRCLVAWCK